MEYVSDRLEDNRGDDSRRPASSIGTGVRQIMNACAHVVNGIRRMKHACANGLLTEEDDTKVQYATKCCEWGERVYDKMKSRGGSGISAQTMLDILLEHEQEYTKAMAALSGPHVSLISTIKLNAHVLTSKKGKKKRKDTINVTLSKALKAVNCINSVWYAMTHINDFLWDIIRTLPSETEEEISTKMQLVELRGRITTAIRDAQRFSDNARMKIAEESLKRNFIVPSSKQFRGVTKEFIFGNASVLKSEVVFRVEGKLHTKVSKKQPMRLSIVGQQIILTVSTLKSETLTIPPKPVTSISTSIPRDTDDQFAIMFADGTQPLVLKAKVPAQRDRWVNFFLNSKDEVDKLINKVEKFEDELATPAHPMLAQRPSMAEISLFNQTRKNNLSASVAWEEEDEVDGSTEGISSEQVFGTLGDIYDGPSSETVPDMRGYCTPQASRCATPQMNGNSSRSGTPTRFVRSATPLRHSQRATPTKNWVTFKANTSGDELERGTPSPTRSITSMDTTGEKTTTFSAVNAIPNSANVSTPTPKKPTPTKMKNVKSTTLC